MPSRDIYVELKKCLAGDFRNVFLGSYQPDDPIPTNIQRILSNIIPSKTPSHIEDPVQDDSIQTDPIPEDSIQDDSIRDILLRCRKPGDPYPENPISDQSSFYSDTLLDGTLVAVKIIQGGMFTKVLLLMVTIMCVKLLYTLCLQLLMMVMMMMVVGRESKMYEKNWKF